MIMSREDAERYIEERHSGRNIPEDQYERMLADLMELRHKPWCQIRRMKMPNLLTDCTCDESAQPN